jgi:hypothetical protein
MINSFGKSRRRAAERTISEVALEGYRYFEMRGKTSEYGRALPSP